MTHLKTASDGGFVGAAKPRRPREAENGRKVIVIRFPDTLIRVGRPASDQNNLCQVALLRSASGMKSFGESAPRVSEDRSIAAQRATRPVLARNTQEIWHTEQVISNAEVEREAGSNFPVILYKEVELVLIGTPDSSSRAFRLSRR